MRTIALVLILVYPLISVADDECTNSSLNILLTNDDGVGTDGIIALHRALSGAGHNVKRIAPDRNYSGSAASISTTDRMVVNQSNEEFSAVYAVDGSPATSVILGATAIFNSDEPLSLVVSGINSGANIGPAAPVSGTVGAVVVALRLLDAPVPGIAISTSSFNDRLFVSQKAYQTHLHYVADFIARLIEKSQCGEHSFLASGQSLNINYPPVRPAEIKGIKIARQGVEQSFKLKYVASGEGLYEIQFDTHTPQREIAASDTILYRQNVITIVPIDGNYSAAPLFDVEGFVELAP